MMQQFPTMKFEATLNHQDLARKRPVIHLAASHPIASHPIASHPIASHPIANRLGVNRLGIPGARWIITRVPTPQRPAEAAAEPITIAQVAVVTVVTVVTVEVVDVQIVVDVPAEAVMREAIPEAIPEAVETVAAIIADRRTVNAEADVEVDKNEMQSQSNLMTQN
jgi:hypothetical protein